MSIQSLPCHTRWSTFLQAPARQLLRRATSVQPLAPSLILRISYEMDLTVHLTHRHLCVLVLGLCQTHMQTCIAVNAQAHAASIIAHLLDVPRKRLGDIGDLTRATPRIPTLHTWVILNHHDLLTTGMRLLPQALKDTRMNMKSTMKMRVFSRKKFILMSCISLTVSL